MNDSTVLYKSIDLLHPPNGVRFVTSHNLQVWEATIEGARNSSFISTE